MPPLRTDVERCGRQRGSDTGQYFGTGPQSSHINSATVFKECRRGEDASHEQPQPAERNGRESRTSQPDEIRNDGVSRFSKANQARYPSTSAQEVSEIAIQTESCHTIYVTKDTLVTYTIAIVQNTQTLQFDQMQVALQTVQNHTSIETPLKAEQLMTAHFNLAISMDNIALNSVVDVQASETGLPDARPAAFTSEEETICKTPHPNSRSNKRNRSAQLTTAVLPTYRTEPGPVRGIPAGYESDNSWDFSDAGEADYTRLHQVTPLVAYTLWRGHPNRGWEQNHGQGHNITVWGGNAPHPRPWQNQPYGRRTRSQQALRTCAYRKWQHQHDIS